MKIPRGFRGATTVVENSTTEMLAETKTLILKMIQSNGIQAADVSHIFFTVSPDLNAVFPAKIVREIPGWSHVPVMCMQEIDVPGAIDKCIRVMLVATTSLDQTKVQHVFLNEAIRLRPDLTIKEGE